MKIKNDFDLSLLESLGFAPFSKEAFGYDDFFEYFQPEYLMSLGHSRRGQFYYFFVRDRELLLYASKPDGSGGTIEFPLFALNFLVKMQELGAFEETAIAA